MFEKVTWENILGVMVVFKVIIHTHQILKYKMQTHFEQSGVIIFLCS